MWPWSVGMFHCWALGEIWPWSWSISGHFRPWSVDLLQASTVNFVKSVTGLIHKHVGNHKLIAPQSCDNWYKRSFISYPPPSVILYMAEVHIVTSMPNLTHIHVIQHISRPSKPSEPLDPGSWIRFHFFFLRIIVLLLFPLYFDPSSPS